MKAAIAMPIDDDIVAPASEPPRVPSPASRIDVAVRDPAALDASFLRDWSALAGDAAEPNSFAEPWFVTAGLRNLLNVADVRLIEVRDGADARLVGVIVLEVRPRYGRIPLRHVQNWKHDNDFLGVPLIRAGYEHDFWRALIEALDGADWARGFLHLNALAEDGPVHAGLAAAATALGRPCEIVHRQVRAKLASQLSPDAYYADTVRKKKRKELGRLARRLGELGAVTSATLGPDDDLRSWCDAFLRLERAGWKGRSGSALACARETEGFFRDAVAGAHLARRLEFRRMDLNGRPIAMLVNFLAPPGSFSFKTAFDEDYAKFSPGVLIQLDNLSLMDRPDIDWMDSCAAPDHPMIDSLWGERRSIVRVSMPLCGMRRSLEYGLARALEKASAKRRETLRDRQAGEEQSND